MQRTLKSIWSRRLVSQIQNDRTTLAPDRVGTAVALGFALWLQVLRAGFDLLGAFRERWEARHLIESEHEPPDLHPELLGVWSSLRGDRWLFFPSWLHGPLRKALNHLSLLIVGVVALVRVAHGEPTLRLFF